MEEPIGLKLKGPAFTCRLAAQVFSKFLTSIYITKNSDSKPYYKLTLKYFELGISG
jgi:hypothetical protein